MEEEGLGLRVEASYHMTAHKPLPVRACQRLAWWMLYPLYVVLPPCPPPPAISLPLAPLGLAPEVSIRSRYLAKSTRRIDWRDGPQGRARARSSFLVTLSYGIFLKILFFKNNFQTNLPFYRISYDAGFFF